MNIETLWRAIREPAVTAGNSYYRLGWSCIEKASITENYTKIVDWAFAYTKLSILIVNLNTPPSLSSNASLNSSCRILVPYGKGDTYKGATNWASFADMIFELHEDGSRPTEAEIQAIIAEREAAEQTGE